MNAQIYERLVHEYNRQSQLLKEECAGINLLEYHYLSNCLDCMEYMDKYYQIDLDCSAISLEVLDVMFDHAHAAIEENSFDHAEVFVEMFSGYVGMVYKNELGGEFVYDETGEALNCQTNHLYPKKDVEACIYHHQKITTHFQQIKEMLS